MRKSPGITDVFLDVEEIAAGEDFVRRIYANDEKDAKAFVAFATGPQATPLGKAKGINPFEVACCLPDFVSPKVSLQAVDLNRIFSG